MRLLRQLWLRLRSIAFGRSARVELDRELNLHIDQLVREGIADGLTEDEARRAAARAFGSRALVAEQCHDTRRVGLIEDFVKDIKYAIRLLVRSPGFALAAILSLALGIGANTAMFSLVNAVLIRPLPVADPDELVFIEAFGADGMGGGAPPYPCFERFRQETSAFSGMAAFTNTDLLRVELEGAVEAAIGQAVSGSYFDVLGLRPALGRLFSQEDEDRGVRVAVLGYGYWQRRFGGAADVVGRTITFNMQPYVVVGVTAREFTGVIPGRPVDVTLPMLLSAERKRDAFTWWFDVVARVPRDVPRSRARAEADAVFQSFIKAYPPEPGGPMHTNHIELTPAARGVDTLRTRFTTPLVALVGAALLVLALGCVNVGTLLLVRGAARARELAIRVATGAGAGRLIRQLLTETLVIFAIGSAAGLVVAAWTVRALAGIFAVGRNPLVFEVHFDWRVLLFATGTALATTLATGLWPALRARRADPSDAMRDGHPRVAGSRRSHAVGRVLIISQIALSLVLLVTAVIFVKTMWNLRNVELGFHAPRVLTMSVYPELAGVSVNARQQLWASLLERVQRLPGVGSASLSVLTPLSGRDTGRRVEVAGFQPRSNMERTVRVNHVTDDYFRTFAMPIRTGRAPARQDASMVAVINEAASRTYFEGRNPIGQTLQFGSMTYEVVGVVANHKHRNLRDETPRMVFIPVSQPLDSLSRLTLSVASNEAPTALLGMIRREVSAVAPQALVTEVLDVQEQIDATLVSERLVSSLAVGFALIALGLAAVGLYGVLASSVADRRREFAVRLALGARRGQVASGLFRDVLMQTAVGVAIGLPMAWMAARAADVLLFGVAAADPLNYLTATAFLIAVAGIAAWLPARRAWTIHPSEVLR